MAYIIGSARISEKGGVYGSVGDQKQTSTPDYKGEVSMENFYVHSQGWFVLRPKTKGSELGKAMEYTCNDPNVGYSQASGDAGRLGIVRRGVYGSGKTNGDCSSCVRACIIAVFKVDPGNFSTAGERKAILATGLFSDMGKYKSGMKLYAGDILVTCTKGHTAIVVKGEQSGNTETSASTVLNKTEKWSGVVYGCSFLSVRKWAGTENDRLTTEPNIANGTRVSVCDTIKAKDGSNWYYIKTAKGHYGFCSAAYIKKV